MNRPVIAMKAVLAVNAAGSRIHCARQLSVNLMNIRLKTIDPGHIDRRVYETYFRYQCSLQMSPYLPGIRFVSGR